MVSLGAEVIEAEAPARREYEDAEFQVLLYEFRDGLNNYLAQQIAYSCEQATKHRKAPGYLVTD